MKLSTTGVHEIALRFGWALEQIQPGICLSIYVKGDAQINVYYSTGTIGTALKHPTQGKTQIFRRNCGLADVARIFKNPRAHTGKGYHRNPAKNPRTFFSPIR